MREYYWRGGVFQFRDGEVPPDAVLVETQPAVVENEVRPVGRPRKTRATK